MDDGIQLSPGKLQFIEDMGLFFEQYGVARIGGRVLGLLILADRPLTLDEMAGALGVARSSVSTNVRVSIASELVERVSFPGDRRDYYRVTADTWGRGIKASLEGTTMMRRVAERGLAALAPDDASARSRLKGMLDYCDFATVEFEAVLARWRERHAAQERAKAPPLEGSGRPS